MLFEEARLLKAITDVPTPNVYMTRIKICSLIAPPVNPPTWVTTGMTLRRHHLKNTCHITSLNACVYFEKPSGKLKGIHGTFRKDDSWGKLRNSHPHNEKPKRFVLLKEILSPQHPEKEQNCSTTILLRAATKNHQQPDWDLVSW